MTVGPRRLGLRGPTALLTGLKDKTRGLKDKTYWFCGDFLAFLCGKVGVGGGCLIVGL